MRAPEFWARPGPLPALLRPLGLAYSAAGALRFALRRPARVAVPVLCVGNLVAGGAGKTPVALDLARRLAAAGRRPHILTRGYGGSLAGPARVEPERHAAAEVGDEALLLAAAAPTWIGADRVAAARAAVAAGADALILDDGFQNPALAKDLSLVVVDGGFGFGNCEVIPAGPLREPVERGLARAAAAVLIGEDSAGVGARLAARLPLLRADLAPVGAADLAGRAVLAFAGIGRPAKFFATLEAVGARLVEQRAFPDHHPYREAELREIIAAADRAGALPVTTAKDAVRLPPALRAEIRTVEVELRWREPEALAGILHRFVLSRGVDG